MARKPEPSSITEQEVFPSRLRRLMKERGVTQKELAAVVGMRPQTVSLYVTGQSAPDINCLKKIAEFFHVSSDYLVGITDTESNNMEIQAICNCLGISEACVQKIIKSGCKSEIELLLTNQHIEDFTKLLWVYIRETSREITDRYDEFPNGIDGDTENPYVNLQFVVLDGEQRRRATKLEMYERISAFLREIDGCYIDWFDNWDRRFSSLAAQWDAEHSDGREPNG